MPDINTNSLTTGPSARGKKRALIVGVNGSPLNNVSPLKYAQSDAEGMNWLLGRAECGFIPFQQALHGDTATSGNVRQAVTELIKASKPEDLLFFYFIGHSYTVLHGHHTQTYLVTSDFRHDTAMRQPDFYLSLDWIWKTLLENKEVGDVIVFLDCCYAGEALDASSASEKVLQATAAYLDELERAHLPNSRPSAQEPPTTHMRTIIVSTEAHTPANEELNARGEGHTRMTGLIQSALGGRASDALDRRDDLTILSLYNYLQMSMGDLGPDLQHPILKGTISHRWVLAHHPANNPLLTSSDAIIEQAISGPPLAGPPTPRNGQNRQDFRPGERPIPLPVQQFFDETFCREATFADLDQEQVRTFLQNERVLLQDDYRAGLSERDQMKEFRMLQAQGEHPSYGALLCLGRNSSRWITGASTQYICWKDTHRQGDQLANQDCQGSLLQQFTRVLNLLKQHLGNQMSQGTIPERDKLDERVLGEILANALAHREYVTEPGYNPRAEKVVVEVFSDRIEVSSPGGPPAPIGIETLRRASELHIGTHPRNPQIMRIFYLANHLDWIGTGVARIQRWTEETGLRPPVLEFNGKTQTLTFTMFRPVLPPDYTYNRRITGNASEQHTNNAPFGDAKPILPLPLVSEPVIKRPIDTPRVGPAYLNNNPPNPSPPPPPPVYKQPNNQGSTTPSPFSWKRVGLVALTMLLGIALITSGVLLAPYLPALLNNHVQPTPLPVPASKTIDIATDFPTSGPNATTELPLQNGVQMAITDATHNQMLPGYTLTLVPNDDTGSGNQPDPTVGATNIQHAIANNLVAGIIGPGNSPIAKAELPIANQAPIAIISPNTTYPCLTKGATDDANDCSGNNDIQAQMRPTSQLSYFRMATTDDFQGKAAADYFYNTLHYHKVLILNDYSDLYSLGLTTTFQREWMARGGQAIPMALPEAQSSVQSYQTILQNAIPEQPDLIYFAGDDPSGSYVLQALANIPAFQNVALAGGDGIVDNDFLLEADLLHPHAPIYASLPIQDPAHSGTTIGSNFQQDYISSGYSNYRAYAASAYDCTMILIQAIKIALQKKVSPPHGAKDAAGAKRFRLAILQALAHLTYTGATGTHSFDANGDTTNHTISFYQLNLKNPQASWDWITQVSA